jgi:hypothetical protein
MFVFNMIWAVITEAFMTVKAQMTNSEEQLQVNSHILSGYVKRNVHLLFELNYKWAWSSGKTKKSFMLPFKSNRTAAGSNDLVFMQLLEAMITMKSTSDRVLSSVEIEHELNAIVNEKEYDDDDELSKESWYASSDRITSSMLAKYGYDSGYQWKKSDMDAFRFECGKERSELDDLIKVGIYLNGMILKSQGADSDQRDDGRFRRRLQALFVIDNYEHGSSVVRRGQLRRGNSSVQTQMEDKNSRHSSYRQHRRRLFDFETKLKQLEKQV